MPLFLIPQKVWESNSRKIIYEAIKKDNRHIKRLSFLLLQVKLSKKEIITSDHPVLPDDFLWFA